MLHERVFCAPIAAEAEENFNDYNSPLSFLESIRAQHEAAEGGERPDSFTASLIWDALWGALGTVQVSRARESENPAGKEDPGS